jgi:chromosome segregation ATPase
MLSTKVQESELAAQVKKESAKWPSRQNCSKTLHYEKYLASSRKNNLYLRAKLKDQRQKIAKTVSLISQARQETELLDQIIQGRKTLEQQITSAESELNYIRKEKSHLEKQLVAEKLSLSNTKKLETQKIRQLKKSKKELEQGIKNEATDLKKITNKLVSK